MEGCLIRQIPRHPLLGEPAMMPRGAESRLRRSQLVQFFCPRRGMIHLGAAMADAPLKFAAVFADVVDQPRQITQISRFERSGEVLRQPGRLVKMLQNLLFPSSVLGFVGNKKRLVFPIRETFAARILVVPHEKHLFSRDY